MNSQRSAQPAFPPLLFFMGLAGAGKTFTGNLIASRLQYLAYDLDQDMLPEMRKAIDSRSPFTPEMRARYFETIAQRITELSRKHPQIVLMQAAYKQENRDYLKALHPGITFVHVTAPLDLIMQRLSRRGDRILPEYAQVMATGFEPPKGVPVLINDTEDIEVLWSRFQGLFSPS